MVLAHAGGIDEMLMMVAPIVTFMFTRRVARGRPADRIPDDPKARR